MTEPIKKFGDVRSVEDALRSRELPAVGRHHPQPTPEILTVRDAVKSWVVKRVEDKR